MVPEVTYPPQLQEPDPLILLFSLLIIALAKIAEKKMIGYLPLPVICRLLFGTPYLLQ